MKYIHMIHNWYVNKSTFLVRLLLNFASFANFNHSYLFITHC